MILGLLAAAPAIALASSPSYSPPKIPPSLPDAKTLHIGGNVAYIATGARACGLRSPEWMEKVITAAFQLESYELTYAEGHQPSPSEEHLVWAYMAGSIVSGQSMSGNQCDTLKSSKLLAAMDKLAVHGWRGP
jgi:hypothetical protein